MRVCKKLPPDSRNFPLRALVPSGGATMARATNGSLLSQQLRLFLQKRLRSTLQLIDEPKTFSSALLRGENVKEQITMLPLLALHMTLS